MEALIIIQIILKFTGAIVCATKADKLNRSGFGWAIFGFLMPILAMIIVNCLKPKIDWHEDNTDNKNLTDRDNSEKKNTTDNSPYSHKIFDPNEEMLGDLTKWQKMSFTNLLCLIARSDGDFNIKEMEYLNTCYLGFSYEQCASYLDAWGKGRLFEDLKKLTSSQKNYLLMSALELINCDGRANETEMNALMLAFEELGYTEDQLLEDVQKNLLLMNMFLKNTKNYGC